jgi:2-hydroxychromene-2-carboxylate isomerase
MPASSVEFWFDFGSNYSYITAIRIGQLALAAGVQVEWKPFLLGPIFKSFGWESSPFVLQKEKGAYVWRDMERECQRYGVPWKKPSTFPRGSVLGHRVAIAASREPWLEEFCQAMFQRNFAADLDIEGVEAVAEVLASVGQSSDWIDRAVSSDVKLLLRQQSEEAKARGVFGAPTFFAKKEMFWGNDRLEQALEWAVKDA